MSESKHTPEPWRINLLDETAILGADGSDVVTTDLGDYEQYYLTFEANARRIVACVNACTGIPTEALEAGVVAEMAKALKRIYFMVDSEKQSECAAVVLAKLGGAS